MYGKTRRKDRSHYRRQYRHRSRNGKAICGGRRVRLHHRPTPGRTRCRCGFYMCQHRRYPGDVTKLADLDRIYAQIGKEKGRVDIVFLTQAEDRCSLWAPSPKSTSTPCST